MRGRDVVGIVCGAALGGLVAFVLVRGRHESPASAPPAEAPDEVSDVDGGARRAVFPAVREEVAAVRATVDARWAKLNREAIEALDAGDEASAVALFEQCLGAVPSERIFASNLAEALARLSVREYDRGGVEDRAHSLEHLTRAVELAPDRADLVQRLEQLKKLAQAEEGFWVDTTEHFELSYDGARDELLWKASQITQLLERIYIDSCEAFGTYPVESGRSKIRVILYRRAGFHEVTGIGHWAGGLYDGSVRVPVEDLAREKSALERTLRHEVTHAFVHAMGGAKVPGWLNEGLAQWLESGTLTGQAAAVADARARLAKRELVPLRELTESLGASGDSDRILAAYAQALALVAHIEHAFGDRLLYEMVAGCRSGTTPDATFRRRTGVALDQVADDLARGL